MSQTYYANWGCNCDPFNKYRDGWHRSHKGTDPDALFAEARAAAEQHRASGECSKGCRCTYAALFTADGRTIRSAQAYMWHETTLTEATPEEIAVINNTHSHRRLPFPI